MKHTLLFTRVDGFHGVTDAAVCTFEAGCGYSGRILKLAVTRWISETEEGREAYDDSCEDFNIGDLACCQEPDLLSPYGVSNLSIVTTSGDIHMEFDRHLFDKNLLPKTVNPSKDEENPPHKE